MPQLDDAQFVQQLTACQLRIRAYILTLLPDHNAVDDVQQNANVVLWSKRQEFQVGTEFSTWAYRIAYYEVLAHYRTVSRDRHLFGEALLDKVAALAAVRTATVDRESRWLAECVEELPQEHQAAILERYQPDASVKAMAAAQGKSPGAITKSLARIRRALMTCVQRKMAEEDAL